ncbi:hypothetical protein DDE18_00645 [Nocardioides gansuensis]|uniref:CBS domain-containing protein n=1 Tax=Nocardioides gansuensis TaxID=2138300 RepID=A0A2T8FER4_9ACTN|nr:CBS domain-containing protein [Nocardioides gansuensis]PVG84185.1 hypothetical protein DDE18_00645 [Nocardioides gansuensis]
MTTECHPRSAEAAAPPRVVADAMIHHPKVHGVQATVADLRRFFEDDHVHLALVVDGGRLVSVVDRDDLLEELSGDTLAAALGSLDDRLVAPDTDLTATRQRMAADGGRRLAVVDDDLTLLGLLCLKRSGTGFCSDSDVSARAQERGRA